MESACFLKGGCPDVGLERGMELHERTSTLFRHRLALWRDWRKPLLHPLVGYMVALGKGLCSSWKRCASRDACIEGM